MLAALISLPSSVPENNICHTLIQIQPVGWFQMAVACLQQAGQGVMICQS